MLKRWGFWEWLAYGPMLIAAMVMALNTALAGAPNAAAILPAFLRASWWNYVPLALLILSGIAFLFRGKTPSSPSEPATAVATGAHQSESEWRALVRELRQESDRKIADLKSGYEGRLIQWEEAYKTLVAQNDNNSRAFAEVQRELDLVRHSYQDEHERCDILRKQVTAYAFNERQFNAMHKQDLEAKTNEIRRLKNRLLESSKGDNMKDA
ncbi:MAG TPA: hypothetical protein VFT41_02535 [Gemmatimonadaceae bacterium]|nr:hypothetical protein [Gemmatimonadaceae bacterium]